MSVEQFTAAAGAVTAILVALGGILAQLRQTHLLMNSRMTQLVETTRAAAEKQGELAGRDFASSGKPRAMAPKRAVRRPRPKDGS